MLIQESEMVKEKGVVADSDGLLATVSIL